MASDVIFSSEFVKIFKEEDGVYMESYKTGMSIDNLNSILTQHPEIKIISFTVVKLALNHAPKPAQRFGEIKDRVEIELSEDDLKAFITLNIPLRKLDINNRKPLIEDISKKLKEKGIVYGIKSDIFIRELVPCNKYLVAEGTPAINGTDAVIQLYEFKDAAPEIKEDGKADYYELKLINKVKTGDWLGERIEATQGVPGQTVKGSIIKPIPGKTFSLRYNKQTVMESFEGNRTVLYSRINGAVNINNGEISVSNHIEVDGNIDFKTGNLDFDGSITVKGTIMDGFSLYATGNIEILDMLGVGGAREIVSRTGSVYIRGGISGKFRTQVKADQNIYTRFVDNATLTCSGSLHIGYYSLNSSLKAGEIILDSTSGQMLGGASEAEIRFICPIIGSEIEKRTVIIVSGFDRKQMEKELQNIQDSLINSRNEQQKIKQHIINYESLNELTQFQHKDYTNLLDKFYDIKQYIKSREEKRKGIINYLRTHGDGEITASKRIFPNTKLQIKNFTNEINSCILAATFYAYEGEMKQI